MGKTKRQHYVPRTYLKRFSFDGKRLHTFLISKNMPSAIDSSNYGNFVKDISLADACVSQEYYTIDETNPTNNCGLNAMSLEKNFFQDFAEPKLSSIIRLFDNLTTKVLSDNNPVATINFSTEQLYDLALSTFIQYHRSPRLRHPFESVNSVIKHILKEKRLENGLNNVDDIKGLDVAFTHADKTYLNPYLWRIFCQKLHSYCILLRVSNNGNFFTSDNPVIIHKLGAKGKECFNVNFYRDDFLIFFPLTPNLMLEYYPANFPDALQMDKTISIVGPDYEQQVNKYQYINAEKFVFSHKNNFSLFLKPILQ